MVLMLGGHVEKPGDDVGRTVRDHLLSVTNAEYLLEHLPCVPKKIIFCSTIAVLPWDDNAPVVKYTEEFETGKNVSRTYALVKLLQERLVKEWAKENRCSCQILRIGTVYGPKRDFCNFLGSCLRSLRKGITMDMYAPLQQMWNFVYVNDIARWICRACNILDEERTVNLVSDRNYTTQLVLDTIKDVWPEFNYNIRRTKRFTGQHKAFDSSFRNEILGNEEYDLLSGLKEIREKGL